VAIPLVVATCLPYRKMLLLFLQDVWRHWVAIMEGSVATVLLGVYQSFILKKPISKAWYAVVLNGFLLFACFQAWEEQYTSRLGREADLRESGRIQGVLMTRLENHKESPPRIEIQVPPPVILSPASESARLKETVRDLVLPLNDFQQKMIEDPECSKINAPGDSPERIRCYTKYRAGFQKFVGRLRAVADALPLPALSDQVQRIESGLSKMEESPYPGAIAEIIGALKDTMPAL
jgi:hypothetical protein